MKKIVQELVNGKWKDVNVCNQFAQEMKEDEGKNG